MKLTLSDKDKVIIAYALSRCPIAELGDMIGGDDTQTAQRLVDLARMFDPDTANEMETFIHQFGKGRA